MIQRYGLRTDFATLRYAPWVGGTEATDWNFGPLALVAPMLFLIIEITERPFFDTIPRFLLLELLLPLQHFFLTRRLSGVEMIFQPFKIQVRDR